MKKGVCVALVSAFLSSYPQHYQPPPTLPSSIVEIKKPDEVRQWLNTVLTYKHDYKLYGQRDFWASCGLTYLNRAGDCDDYAICAAALLEGDVEKGYIITLESPVNNDAGHAVFAYQLNNKWGIISNQPPEFREARFSTLHDAVVDVNMARDSTERFRQYSVRDYTGVDIIHGFGDLESEMKMIETKSLQP